MRRTIPFVGVVLLVLALVAPPAGATSGTMIITTDTTLTEDHDGSIVVDADDITLDCDGHTVTGPDLERGISIEGHSGVTVENCLVTGFPLGIVLLDGSSNTLRANSTYSTSGSGVVVDADDSTVVANRASDTGDNGFEVYFCSGNTFKDNVATGSRDAGFVLQDCPDTRFVRNVASGNGGGFAVIESEDIRLIENVARDNGGDGFGVFKASHVLLRGNTALSNGNNGFNVWRSDRNVLTGNKSLRNLRGFIISYSSNDNVLRSNLAKSNRRAGAGQGGAGFEAVRSDGNVFSGNRATANFRGFVLWMESNYNTYVRNVACHNRFLDARDDHGGTGNVWRKQPLL